MDLLLNEIMQAAMCSYLSDLHSDDIVFDKNVRERVAQIPDSHYTVAQWHDAAVYVIGTSCNVASAQETKEIICRRLLI